MNIRPKHLLLFTPFSLCLFGCLLSSLTDGVTVDSSRNADKLHSTRTIALVAVCTYPWMGARQGGAMVRTAVTDATAAQIATAFDSAFGPEMTGVEVSGTAKVASFADLPRGTAIGTASCPDGVQAFQAAPAGQASDRPDPNVKLLGEMATALNVDAVVAILVHPGMSFDDVNDEDSEVELFSGVLNPSVAVVVDRSGAVLLQEGVKAEVTTPNHAGVEALPTAYGVALAKALAATIRED